MTTQLKLIHIIIVIIIIIIIINNTSGIFVCGKWVPVTMASHVLRLRMKEQPPIWKVAANILNKHFRTTVNGWFSKLVVGRRVNNASLLKHIFLLNINRQSLGHGLIIWFDPSNQVRSWDLVLGMLGACKGQVHLVRGMLGTGMGQFHCCCSKGIG